MGELFLFYSSWGHFLTLKVPRPAGRHLARVKEWEACRLSPFHTKCEWRDSGNQTDLSPVDWIWSEAIMLREGGQMNSSELRGIRVAWLWAHGHLISWLKHQRRADLCQTENKGFFFLVWINTMRPDGCMPVSEDDTVFTVARTTCTSW